MSQDESSKIPQGAPMNDVELDLAINTILYDFTESDEIVQAANKRLKALFTQSTRCTECKKLHEEHHGS